MLRLTPAQRSAVECADLESYGALAAAAVRIRFGYLLVPDEPKLVEPLIRDLIDAANSEDAHWHVFGERAAIGACKALSNLATKIRRLGIENQAGRAP